MYKVLSETLKMKVQLLSLMFLLSGSCSSDEKLYLIDLYACVDEFEDYCHQIPEWTVRAAIGLANDCNDMLPGYTLSILNKDFYPNKSLILDGEVLLTSKILRNFNRNLMSQLIENFTITPILLGSPFSFVSQYAVHILGEKENFVQVNFRSTLIDRSSFLYRIGPNEAFFNAARLKLLLNNNWRRVGILSSSGTTSLTAEVLEKQLVDANITVINTASFVIQGKINDSVWNVGQLAELKEEDIRVILTLLPLIEVPLIMCAAYDIGLIDDHHVWILPEMNLNDIRRVAKQYNMCDVDIVLRNVLMVGENYYNFEKNHSLPFGTNDLDDLLIKYNNLSSATTLTDIPGYNLSRVVFDATWAVILGLNNSVQTLAERGWSLEEVVNQNGVDRRILDIIKESLNQVKFSGLSGMIDFSNRDNNTLRMGNSLMTSGAFDTARISQIMNKTSCTVKVYKSTNETTLVSDSGSCNYSWGDYDLLINYSEVPAALLIFTIVISVIFILISVALAVYIIAMRKNEYIKTSSLTLSLAIIIGCGLVLLSSIPRLLTYGVKHYDIDETQFNTLCQVEFSFGTFGWNLVCVFLFLKSWRLYRIQNDKLLRKKIRFISEKAIFIIMLMLLFPTVLLLILQSMFDRSTLFIEKAKDGPYEYRFCDPELIFWEAIFALYNSIIIICSIWQAWHVSQLTIKRLAFLEGKISVRLLLVITISTLFLVAFDFILRDNEEAYDEAIIFRTLESLGFSVTTIFLIFLPKIYLILKKTRKSATKSPHCSSGNSSGKTQKPTV